MTFCWYLLNRSNFDVFSFNLGTALYTSLLLKPFTCASAYKVHATWLEATVEMLISEKTKKVTS